MATTQMKIDSHEQAELKWDQPTVRGEEPQRRSGHTFTAIGEYAYMFGGCDASMPVGPTNELHVLRLSGDLAWVPFSATGETPPPRWRHSAVVYGKSIVVFGGYLSDTERHNDVWMLDTDLKTWSCLHSGEEAKRGKKKLAKKMEPIPSPRGSHSATVIGDKMYVFGGYGGAGYSRREFNDLYAFDLVERRWEKVAAKGSVPEPRAGHAAVAVRDQIFVFGGSSSVQQFNDLVVFDTESQTWSATDCPYGTPRWNASLVAVEAVPHWQVFLFGGAIGDFSESARGMKYDNDVRVLDTGRMQWHKPIISGDIPSGRADTPMAFDSKHGRLLLFGGWANRWYGKVHSLNVQAMVGPPYAILDMSPKLGPNTGGQTVTIHGMGFFNSSINVSFATRRHTEEVPGEFIDATTIQCSTPNFTKLGAVEVDVRVSLGGNSYTNTYQRYSYFDVADARNILAFGPALIPGGAAGHKTCFVIAARDAAGNDRATGGDEFEIIVVSKQGEEVSDIEIEDLGTGKYVVSFTPPTAGEYTVSAEFKGTFKGRAGQVRGGPFATRFDEGLPPEVNDLGGKLVLTTMRERISELNSFTSGTLSGIRKEIPENDVDALLKVKEHLHNKEKRDRTIELELATTEGLLKYLQDNSDRSANVLLNQLAKVQTNWSDVKREAPAVEKDIQPAIKKQREVSQGDIESYETRVATYQKQHKERAFWKYGVGFAEANADLDAAIAEQAKERKKWKNMVYLSTMLEVPELMEKTSAMMDEIDTDLESSRKMWMVVKECQDYIKSARDAKWSEVSPDELEEQTKGLLKQVTSLNRGLRWSGTYKGVSKDVKNFLNTCPLIGALGHTSMRPRHWTLLMKATNKTFTPPHEDPTLQLGTVLNLNLHEFQADVEEITDQAVKEEKMEQQLEKLETTWEDIKFITEDFKDGVQLVKLGEEEFETLENDQLGVQSMLASRYLATFEERVRYWHKTLGNVSDVMGNITEIQRTWSYLEPLFIGSEEVKRELPKTAESFAKIDTGVKAILRDMVQTENVAPACNKEGLLKELEDISAQLDVCKKSLKDFLDGKRQLFPRFYFVSEADLLDILSNGSVPSRIMKHITKVFLATDNLELQQDDGAAEPKAIRWISAVGKEDVPFEPALLLKGKVESYLQDVLEAMQKTINNNIERCLQRYGEMDRITWLTSADDNEHPLNPAQVHVLVAAIFYIREVEETFDSIAAGADKSALRTYNEKQIQQLNDLIMLTRTKLSKGDRTKVMVMITMDTHGRDVIQRLIMENVTAKTEFQWQSQLKHRFLAERNVAIATIADATFDYGYEYLGNGARLVITPLTDRIYVTATQALNLKMGCAPAGPAGTGKTETTKDLASSLGKVCYVFNCSPEMDYQSMGNIFKGLAASGAWGCFDEFNRLIPEVLSVCSVQFKAVCDAVRDRSKTVTIEGDTVKCDWTVGAFITMNPGYLGRSELPEGLKSLFRPITVMVPDLVLICENMLMAEGFKTAKVLASKFYGLYSLLRDLLSKQSHYDWGLRAVKSVLVVAGAFLRAEPEFGEEELLMRALRDMNTPKIVQQDTVVFFGLLGDLFPGINPPRKSDPALEVAVKEACAPMGLHADPYFCLKCVQLDELMAIRHCTFVMGPPGAGKSMCWRNLAKARNIKPAHLKDLNPKAISTEQLYGYVAMATREWKDGLLSIIMRDLGNVEGTDPKWIVLDGDLDANWIESMNSVMDDNKMLTLASNERIPLKGHMKMLFEIRDLRFATPATVSRAGILYIATDDGTQWRSLIEAWVANLDTRDVVRAVLRQLFEMYVAPSLRYMRKTLKPLVPLEPMNLVQTLLYMLEGLLTEEVQSGKDVKEVRGMLEPTFVWACVWAFGSCLSEKDGVDYRHMFSEFWKAEFKNVKFPGRDLVFDVYLDQASGKFGPWTGSEYFQELDFDSTTMSMANITVPTPETASITFWLDLLVKRRRAAMLVGGAGCGKTAIVKGLCALFKPEERTSKTINFHFFMNSDVLRLNMETPLEKKVGSTFGPVGQSHLVYFLDDLNLPEVDPYDTQSAIALVRQHMDYEHWFDPSAFTKGARHIINTQYLACMNPTAGSFTVNPRLQRHFATFAVGFPGSTSLLAIYKTFLHGHLSKRGFKAEVLELSSALLNAALSLHSKVAQTFRKSAINFHYEFSLRHLSNVFQGLLVARPGEFIEPAKFVYLWLHESERVYGDRLVNARDLAKYKALAQDSAKKKFPNYPTALFFSGQNPSPLIFCHFVTSLEDKIYDQVNNMADLERVVSESLDEYNETYAAMNLVLFADALKHVCRIARIVLNPGGHALLVGVGGSGKQSLSRLAAFMCGYSTFQITLTATYSVSDLKEDLKTMYNKAGLKDEGMLFLFTDSQISNERFLVYINDLLASGDIPDLYAVEEKDEIVNSVVGKVKAAGLTPDRATSWDFFINTVRRNLHMSLCFSPVGDDFRTRCLRFPAIVNCTVIDWFQPWPEDALHSVGKRFLADTNLGEDTVRGAIEDFMPFSFKSVNAAAAVYLRNERRYCYTTPKSYLELLGLYNSLLGQKRDEMGKMISRLSNGLTKLRETADAVAKIEEDLKVLLEEAEEKKVRAESIADTVAKEKATVEKATAEAAVEAEKCEAIATDVAEQQRSCESDLAKAEPAVEAAMQALNTLNKKDLGSCRTMTKPPPGVDDVFYAVMVLTANVFLTDWVQKNGKIRESDRNWANAKKGLLTNVTQFLDQLQSFKQEVDDGHVPDINFKEVRQYLDLEHFTKEVISGKNSAAGGLCSWVINIVMYRDIVVTVEPKRQALAKANEDLNAANTRLAEVQAHVKDLEEKLAKLTEEYDRVNKEKEDAIEMVESGQKRLGLAQRLIRALADENVRWAESIERLKGEQGVLVGDVLLASAFISYIGPFTKKYRDQLIGEQWLPFLQKAAGGEPIPMSESSNPLHILTSEAEMAKWQQQGLPADRVSMENGAIVSNSKRWPLMIDPQLQGIAWVREKEAEHNLLIVRLGQNRLVNKLTTAIEAGHSVLIENMGERIDASLMPVIQRATIRRGRKQVLQMGGQEVEFSPDFRLFLHTKLSNPHYPPEIQAECTLVNFTVTELGLEDQLLSLVVEKERPDLAEERTLLIQQQNQYKVQMKELEDLILNKLASAEGDVTQDVELIESLENAKKISNEINVKVVIARETTAQINATSELYRPVAARGSLLFFLMNELYKVHTYYIYSLSAFVVVFLRGIDLVALGPADGTDDEPAAAEPAGESAPDAAAVDGAGEGQDAAKDDDAAKDADAAGEEGKEAAEEKERDQAGEEKGADAPATDAEAEVARKRARVRVLSPPEIADRCLVLQKSIMDTVFDYLRRGLFERDKLTVATLLCIKVLLRDEKLDPIVAALLIEGRSSLEPGEKGTLHWMPDAVWARVKALEAVKPVFEKLGETMQTYADEWEGWYSLEKPEDAKKIPGEFPQALLEEHKLLLLRAMRPDRLRNALARFISSSLGDNYINEPPFDMAKAFAESSPATPLFFVLFPGVDPTVWVETLGAKIGFTTANGKFINISMGQGQEEPAMAALKRFVEGGGWIMLQNVHLMQSWLPQLERELEVASEKAHKDFRCYISAEPPPMSHMKNMPESLMQTAIKVSNEAPADLKSNLRRGWAAMNEDKISSSEKPMEFKACLMTLCLYHALILGRRRFGQQGWSRKYSFNMGDLTVCANVLYEYLNNNPVVPWDDLRYIFGEIMYGGHITDAWDRRTNNTYLKVLLTPSIFEGKDIIPDFPAPDTKALDYDALAHYIEEKLPSEAPQLFGMHPNAEIGYLTMSAQSLLATILTLTGGVGTGDGDGDGGKPGGGIISIIESLQERQPENFDMLDLQERAEEQLKGESAPYVVVLIQECSRMNTLLGDMRRTLKELKMGLNGELNMTDAMEDLQQALSINQVPGRNPFHKCSWEKLAWFSNKNLQSWFDDLLLRVEQLNVWSSDLVLPKIMWLPGLFNPTAFTTACMQVTARRTKRPLDRMTIETHVTPWMTAEAAGGEDLEYPEDGAYITGLYMEGARWMVGDDAGDVVTVGITPTQGFITEARLKKLLDPMPIMYVKAVEVQSTWIATDVGYVRNDPTMYECPFYTTTFRGPTYVWLATLKTQAPVEKWILAGVALVAQTDD